MVKKALDLKKNRRSYSTLTCYSPNIQAWLNTVVPGAAAEQGNS